MDSVKEKLVELVGKARKEAAKKCHSFFSCKDCPNQDDNNPMCRNTYIAESLIAHGVTVQQWIPVSEPPTTFRDEYGELIPFLVCEEGTEYPFRAMYDGKTWGDGFFAIPVTHWMPLPQPPKGETHNE